MKMEGGGQCADGFLGKNGGHFDLYGIWDLCGIAGLAIPVSNRGPVPDRLGACIGGAENGRGDMPQIFHIAACMRGLSVHFVTQYHFGMPDACA